MEWLWILPLAFKTWLNVGGSGIAKAFVNPDVSIFVSLYSGEEFLVCKLVFSLEMGWGGAYVYYHVFIWKESIKN